MIKLNPDYIDDDSQRTEANYFIRSRGESPVTDITNDVTSNRIAVFDGSVNNEFEFNGKASTAFAIDKSETQSLSIRSISTKVVKSELFLGKIESVELEEAQIRLCDELGNEFYGQRNLSDFNELSLTVGDYFYCTVETLVNGTVQFKFAKAERRLLDKEAKDAIDREVEDLFGK